MDADTKRFFALMLTEIYRIERHLDPNLCHASDSIIFALRNGFENVINEQLEEIGFIPEAHVSKVTEVMNRYYSDTTKLNELTGFYDFERELEDAGVSRIEAKIIITWLKARGRFAEVIAKLDSSNSPDECRTFDMHDFD